MGSKRRLLFLMPSLRGGGAERTLINLLHKIDPARYHVDLIVVSKKGPYVEQVPEYVNISYLYQNDYIARILMYLHSKFRLMWFFEKKMKKIEKKYDMGISFLDCYVTDLLFMTEKIEKRIAFIHSSYRTHENYERFYSKEKLNRRLRAERYSRLDAIYFVSEDSMKEFIDVMGVYPEMGVVYNLIDREAVIRKSEEPFELLENETFAFSAVGSLMEVKGFDRLIRAAAIVKDKGYSFTIHLAGTGAEEEKLRALICELGLEEEVYLYGFLPNPYPLMKQSDVFVMSSKSEALPTVLCEAMMLGVPTLVTDCSGCRGIVDHGEFGLMAEQDDHDYAGKMMRYMDEPELLVQYREKSLERAEIFDDEKVLNRYYNIFDGNVFEYPKSKVLEER